MGMGIAFIKFLKWLISAGFFILGIALLQKFSDTGDFKPVAGVIMCFGVVFWMSKSTYEAPKNIFVTTVLVLALAGIVARGLIEAAAGAYIDLGSYYFVWFLCATGLGLPTMIYTFLKE